MFPRPITAPNADKNVSVLFFQVSLYKIGQKDEKYSKIFNLNLQKLLVCFYSTYFPNI